MIRVTTFGRFVTGIGAVALALAVTLCFWLPTRETLGITSLAIALAVFGFTFSAIYTRAVDRRIVRPRVQSGRVRS